MKIEIISEAMAINPEVGTYAVSKAFWDAYRVYRKSVVPGQQDSFKNFVQGQFAPNEHKKHMWLVAKDDAGKIIGTSIVTAYHNYNAGVIGFHYGTPEAQDALEKAAAKATLEYLRTKKPEATATMVRDVLIPSRAPRQDYAEFLKVNGINPHSHLDYWDRKGYRSLAEVPYALVVENDGAKLDTSAALFVKEVTLENGEVKALPHPASYPTERFTNLMMEWFYGTPIGANTGPGMYDIVIKHFEDKGLKDAADAIRGVVKFRDAHPETKVSNKDAWTLPTNFDHVIIGGGAAGLHAALAYRKQFPDRTVAVIDSGLITEPKHTTGIYTQEELDKTVREIARQFGAPLAHIIQQQLKEAAEEAKKFSEKGVLAQLQELGGVTLLPERRLISLPKGKGKGPVHLQVLNGNLTSKTFHVAAGAAAQKWVKGLDDVTFKDGDTLHTINGATLCRRLGKNGTLSTAFAEEDAILRILHAQAVTQHYAGNSAALDAWQKMSHKLPGIPKNLRGNLKKLKEYMAWFENDDIPADAKKLMMVNWHNPVARRWDLLNLEERERQGRGWKSHRRSAADSNAIFKDAFKGWWKDGMGARLERGQARRRADEQDLDAKLKATVKYRNEKRAARSAVGKAKRRMGLKRGKAFLARRKAWLKIQGRTMRAGTENIWNSPFMRRQRFSARATVENARSSRAWKWAQRQVSENAKYYKNHRAARDVRAARDRVIDRLSGRTRRAESTAQLETMLDAKLIPMVELFTLTTRELAASGQATDANLQTLAEHVGKLAEDVATTPNAQANAPDMQALQAIAETLKAVGAQQQATLEALNRLVDRLPRPDTAVAHAQPPAAAPV